MILEPCFSSLLNCKTNAAPKNRGRTNNNTMAPSTRGAFYRESLVDANVRRIPKNKRIMLPRNGSNPWILPAQHKTLRVVPPSASVRPNLSFPKTGTPVVMRTRRKLPVVLPKKSTPVKRKKRLPPSKLYPVKISSPANG